MRGKSAQLYYACYLGAQVCGRIFALELSPPLTLSLPYPPALFPSLRSCCDFKLCAWLLRPIQLHKSQLGLGRCASSAAPQQHTTLFCAPQDTPLSLTMLTGSWDPISGLRPRQSTACSRKSYGDTTHTIRVYVHPPHAPSNRPKILKIPGILFLKPNRALRPPAPHL